MPSKNSKYILFLIVSISTGSNLVQNLDVSHAIELALTPGDLTDVTSTMAPPQQPARLLDSCP